MKRRMITYKGETLPLSEWAKRAGINNGTLRFRVLKGERPPYAFRQARFQSRHGEVGQGGDERSAEWIVWMSMRQRCFNKKHSAYKDYGGRGITVCKEWDDYRNFLHDMGRRPSQQHTIDRHPDNNGDYGPQNCRWATASEQMRNYRGNTILEFRGKAQCIAAWADELGLPSNAIYHRMKQWGDVERALTTPLTVRNR